MFIIVFQYNNSPHGFRQLFSTIVLCHVDLSQAHCEGVDVARAGRCEDPEPVQAADVAMTFDLEPAEDADVAGMSGMATDNRNT